MSTWSSCHAIASKKSTQLMFCLHDIYASIHNDNFSETSIMIIISGLMRPSDFVDSRSELEVQIQPKSVNIIHLLLPSAILNL